MKPVGKPALPNFGGTDVSVSQGLGLFLLLIGESALLQWTLRHLKVLLWTLSGLSILVGLEGLGKQFQSWAQTESGNLRKIGSSRSYSEAGGGCVSVGVVEGGEDLQ